jgi:hypothetical protein
MMRCLNGFARGLGLDEATTSGIVEKIAAGMPDQPDEERFAEELRRMIVPSAKPYKLSETFVPGST